MKLLRWEELPSEMRIPQVRVYYDILFKKRITIKLIRVFDIIVALSMLAIMLPIFVILAVAIKLDSAGPVFYRQERVTQYGKHFMIHKFRTMVENADKGPQVTMKHDVRITRVGSLIRSCRLDETAQLIDLLYGNLTLVGTRPEVPKYVEHYTPDMMATLLLPAGITSEASIYYKDEAKLLDSAEDVDNIYLNKILPEKMRYNLLGIKKLGIIYNLKVMVKTVLSVFCTMNNDSGAKV